MKKNLIKLGLLAVLLTSSGCVGSLAYYSTLMAMGSLGSFAGFMIAANDAEDAGSDAEVLRKNIIAGVLLVGSIALDAKDPGHSVAMNPVPVDEELARKLGVSTDQIESYNDRLNEMQPYAQGVIADARELIQNPKNKEELEKKAQKYGFATGHELKETLRGDRLGAERVAQVAAAMKLSEADARILLGHGFGIKL